MSKDSLKLPYYHIVIDLSIRFDITQELVDAEHLDMSNKRQLAIWTLNQPFIAERLNGDKCVRITKKLINVDDLI